MKKLLITVFAVVLCLISVFATIALADVVNECDHPDICATGFIPCRIIPPDNCYCWEVSERGLAEPGSCANNFFCPGWGPCSTKADCPFDDEGVQMQCYVHTCCGKPGICGPNRCTGVIESPSGAETGQTATGKLIE